MKGVQVARLILTYNTKVVSNHQLVPERELTIGRDPESSIWIDHSAVSQQHANIIIDDKGLFIHDLGSTNGTIVNDEKMTSCQLAHQDWIVIGKHLLIVDLYETLSLEAAARLLKSETVDSANADGTLMIERDQFRSNEINLDVLKFESGEIDDLELTDKPVYIGKNKDAEIVIKGFWAFFAGEPTAKIEKHSGDYYLEFVSGLLKPKINYTPIQKPTKIKNLDVVTIGSLTMQFHRIRLSYSPLR